MTAPLPVLMWPTEIVGVKDAARRAKLSPKTIRRWCHNDGIGRQASNGGPLQVSITALEMRLNNDFSALDLLRQGHRDRPEVLRYLRHLQLVP